MNEYEAAIIIPAYNEEKVIRKVLESLKAKYPDYAIIVVDDGSNDNTYKEVSKVKDIFLLRHIINLGQGAALQTGIEMAKMLNVTYIVTFDADGQHDLNDIEVFLREIKEKDYDIILGSRFLNLETKIPLIKKIVLKAGVIFTRFVNGVKVTDTHNGFRVINLKKVPDFELRQNRMGHATEIYDIIKKKKLKYKEMSCSIYYTEYSRQKGQRISNIINILFDYFFQRLSK